MDSVASCTKPRRNLKSLRGFVYRMGQRGVEPRTSRLSAASNKSALGSRPQQSTRYRLRLFRGSALPYLVFSFQSLPSPYPAKASRLIDTVTTHAGCFRLRIADKGRPPAVQPRRDLGDRSRSHSSAQDGGGGACVRRAGHPRPAASPNYSFPCPAHPSAGHCCFSLRSISAACSFCGLSASARSKFAIARALSPLLRYVFARLLYGLHASG
jgi:hypothetical protein